MRLSLQVHYAICGVFDLAYNGQGRPVQVRVIGERQQIPNRYLEQIFQRLRRAGLVRSKRGPGGGYTLARAAAEITLCDIVEAVDGPIGQSPSRANRTSPTGEGESGGTPSFRPNFLWDELSERFAGVLGETTIESLCQQASRRAVHRAGAETYTYQI